MSLKLGVKIEPIYRPTNQKNWLTSGVDPVPDTDSGSLFSLPSPLRNSGF